MAIQDDYRVAQNGNIRYVGSAGAGYYSVIQFHHWLQGLADDAVAPNPTNNPNRATTQAA